MRTPLAPAEPVAAAAEAIDHEQVLVRRGARTGLYTIVAVHSTVLGPALGGCRMWHYPAPRESLDDALRLSRAMTYKAAAAGLSLGGGKGVICLPDRVVPSPSLRREILRDFADTVSALEGRYITAEDVGTTSEDMAMLARFTPYVVGRPGGAGDPGAFTAAGVQAAMRACAAQVLGSSDLARHTVAVVGLGSVGAAVARGLAAAGAELVLSDIDAGKAELAAELGGRWLEPEDALAAEVDVLAPCALGGMLDAGHVARLRCRVVCGAANNQLADDALAQTLHERGILYAPDFIVNAGGLINVSLELTGYDDETARRRCLEIEDVLGRVLAHAKAHGTPPLAAAHELAERWLTAAGAASGSM